MWLKNRIINGLIFFLFLYVTEAFALEDDKNQPLYLQADSVSIDHKSGQSVYEGQVTVQQGSTHLTAARATVFTDPKSNALIEAIAEGISGSQVHYWTTLDPNKPELNAYADVIRILPQKNVVYLIGHAKVIQGNDSYEAPEIEYNTKTQHVLSKKSAQGRTAIIIHPTTNNTKIF